MGENEKLIQQYRDTDDRKCLDILVNRNAGLVYNIAKKFFHCTPDSSHDDLIQQGWMGFLVALKKYNQDFNVKFASYAAIWIQSRIQRYMEWDLPMVRTLSTQGARKAMFKYGKIASELVSKDPTISDDSIKTIVSQRLGIGEEHIDRVQSFRRHLVRLDAPVTKHSSSPETKISMMESDSESPEDAIDEKLEFARFKKYYDMHTSRQSPKKRQIIEMIFFSKLNLAEVGRIAGVTRERVRQIKVEATKKIREGMER